MKKKYKKELTPEEKLNASLKKIDSVFKRMHTYGISLRENKGMSDTTVSTYKNLMKSLMKDIFKDTGKSDITKIREKEILDQLEKRVKKYKNGSQNESYNIKTIRSAVKSFAFGATQTKIFQSKMNFDGKKIDQMIKNERIVRKSRFTSTLKATTEQCETVIKIIESTGYKTPTKKIAAEALRIATYSGARISAALNLRPEDIIENLDGTVTVWFMDDKGGLDHKTDIYDKNHIKYFKQLKDTAVPGHQILKGKRGNQTFKSTDDLRLEISKIIREAGAEFKKVVSVRYRKDGKRVTEKSVVKFSAHAGRKAFANERVKVYWNLLKEKEITEILKEKYSEEFEKVMGKYKNEVEDVNSFRKKDQKDLRNLNREEQAIFLTSLDTGHYRNNVLRQYYLDIPKFRKYQREK